MWVLVILIVLVTAIPCLAIGGWLGMSWTARNADRVLAVMSDEQIVQTARKARIRRQLLTPAPRAPASEG